MCKMNSIYDLPVSCMIAEKEYPIRNRGDYRVVLDTISALNDPELTEQQKIYATLYIFYGTIPEDIESAIKEMFLFINCGRVEKKQLQSYKIMDWEQDFKILTAPINRVLGTEIRNLSYLHWWTFIAAYAEIGDCTFANVVTIREKLRKGIKLERYEREFYQKNRDMIDLQSNLTREENAWIDEILGGENHGI